MQQLEESIARYLTELDRADREPTLMTEARVSHIKGKIAAVKAQMRQLKQIGSRMSKAPDGQISLTDPDARSMATSGRGTGIVGYNVQTAVDAKHHMIVAHEVTNVGHDREQLLSMARQARDGMGTNKLTVLADRGYFKGEEILGCEEAGITTLVPSIGWAFWAATACMAIGVWLHLTEDHEHDHVHELLVHSHAHSHDSHHQHEHEGGWNGSDPHAHEHRHEPIRHRHPHFPDIHHEHTHG